MADFTFYTVAMSRGQISRWALHEAGADYEHVVFDWATRPHNFTDINPMNKVPALVHRRPRSCRHRSGGDQSLPRRNAP
jgi:glutathione S-transferase